MSDYKLASKLKLRFQTPKGELTTEQLWTLTTTELDTLAVSLDEAYKASKGKSFLDKRTTKDKSLKLQFDIVFDVMQTKVEEEESEKQARDDKEHNQKIFELIAKKKEGELEGLSIAELEAKLR